MTDPHTDQLADPDLSPWPTVDIDPMQIPAALPPDRSLLASAEITPGHRQENAYDYRQAIDRLTLQPPTAPTARTRPGLRPARAAAALEELCLQVVNHDSAPVHLAGLVNHPLIDPAGALVHGCLLHLAALRTCREDADRATFAFPDTGRTWWQIAAGAGVQQAAWCMHLWSAARGDIQDAHLWRAQAGDLTPGGAAPEQAALAPYTRTRTADLCRTLHNAVRTQPETRDRDHGTVKRLRPYLLAEALRHHLDEPLHCHPAGGAPNR
ncbi:hypothetical protein [Kitasatospora sp. NPDC093679]|uniref:hypothetical protein n=1 Tax=Kitasatospora sp. NPDC093679 TaxID=3154983 RepID=UPI0034476EF3